MAYKIQEKILHNETLFTPFGGVEIFYNRLSSCKKTGTRDLPFSVKWYSMCNGFCFMIILFNKPVSSSSLNASDNVCLLEPCI